MKREIEDLRKRIEDQSSMFKGQINKSGAMRNRRGAAEMEEVSKRKTRRLSAAGSRERRCRQSEERRQAQRTLL